MANTDRVVHSLMGSDMVVTGQDGGGSATEVDHLMYII